jgi:hypothetical protein
MEEVKKTSEAEKKPYFLILHFILTFWIFIVSGYVLSVPLSYSLCADKLSNSVTKTVQIFNPNGNQEYKFYHYLLLQVTFNIQVYNNFHKDGEANTAEGYMWFVLIFRHSRDLASLVSVLQC